MFAKQFRITLEYDAVCLPKDNFAEGAKAFFTSGGKGANVTLPFKLDAFEMADVLSQRAQMAGAVNTLSCLADGKLQGDNTDGQGLVEDLIRIIGDLSGKRVLLLGAGGAARGVLLPLLDAGVADIAVHNRTQSKVDELIANANVQNVYMATEALIDNSVFDIAINSTSSSVSGDLPSVSDAIFKRACLAYDMFYKKGDTAFMSWAKQVNKEINVSDGLGMLVGQAAESFRIWHDRMPEISPVIDLLRKNL